MRRNNKKETLMVNASLPSAGITSYQRIGQTVVRSATSRQPRRRTEKQFAARQRLAHTNNLWNALRRACTPLLSGGPYPYALFHSLAARLPTVYLTRDELALGAALLMPATPVSSGTLTPIACRLGSLGPSPALLTDLDPGPLPDDERLMLVHLWQRMEHDVPRVEAATEEVDPALLVPADGGLALVDSRLDDPHSGWALVRCRHGACSAQTAVTPSTLHTAYTTRAALLRAAASYGGLTGER